MRIAMNPFIIPIVNTNIYGVQKISSVLNKNQSEGAANFTTSNPPAILPIDWKPSCKLLERTGLLSYFTDAASSEISPILTANKIMNKIDTTSICSSGLVRLRIRGNERNVDAIRLSTIQNLRRPYLGSVYRYTIGAELCGCYL
jgi:hypothetical protein